MANFYQDNQNVTTQINIEVKEKGVYVAKELSDEIIEQLSQDTYWTPCGDDIVITPEILKELYRDIIEATIKVQQIKQD